METEKISKSEELSEDGWTSISPQMLKAIGCYGCLQIATRHEELETCLPEPIATMLVGQCQYRSNVARVNGAAKLVL